MRTRERRIRVHFFGRQEARAVSPLCGTLGVGPMPELTGTAARRYARLAAVAPQLFEVVTADSADVWVYAHELVARSEIDSQLRALPPQGPACAFFYGADDAAPIPVSRPNVALFRTSLFASTRLAHEYAMPALCDDVLEETGGEPVTRSWSKEPSVGFCGFVGSSWKRLGFQMLRQQQKNEGLQLRERVLSAFEGKNQVETRFVRRSSFWGGAMSRFHFSGDLQREVRTEFIQNLFATDYGLCVRGKGNFSYRFYEVLSAGRIPVFVDSDSVLPFERQIDWRRHTVWIDHSEIDSVAARIADFHRSLSPEAFVQLQRDNRALWADWLSPESYFVRALESIAERGTC